MSAPGTGPPHDTLEGTVKYLYAHPPAGVPEAQAQAGSQLMYYGGDGLDLIIITILCYRWYHASRPGRRTGTAAVLPTATAAEDQGTPQ
ncbi:MAG: hypothetical protein NVS2B15_17670 [Pseudarthrobacter sp.]